MEEDIKIIEDNIDMFIDTLYECYRQSAVKPFEKAIKNLLAKYKKLKEVEEVVEYFKFCRGSLPKDELLIVMCNEDFCRNFGNDFIPKSKVKEKIEEINNVNNAEALEDLMNNKNYTITQLVQYVLQELLGEE